MKNSIIFFVVVMIVFTIIYFVFFRKKKESSWKPEFRDLEKEKKSMLGMASEGNSLAGMIANPKYGAMTHESNFVGEQVGELKPIKLL